MFQHFISASQFTSATTLEEFFVAVRKTETSSPSGVACGKVMASWFGEASTRTRVSFESAMYRLGGNVIYQPHMASSLAKGESWLDTIKTLGELSDIIVARTPIEGDAANAAVVSKVPFVNAGDGAGEHPTQALLDMYTIWKEFKCIEPLSIGLVGDLKYGRTIHSLLRLLGLYSRVTYHVLCPDRLYLDPREILKRSDIQIRRHACMDDLVKTGPMVVYMTRNQVERREEQTGMIYLPRYHYMRREHADKLPDDSIIMHPFPRGPELTPEIDSSPKAAYWKQVKNGLYVRMTLLQQLLSQEVQN